MKRFEFNNIEYAVGFNYSTDAKNRRTTKVFVKKDNETIAEAISVCSVKDRFTKETGRITAISKLGPVLKDHVFLHKILEVYKHK